MFGIGLILSGMTDPGKVIGFLDVAGAWDPSLAFVMGGAILVGFFGFALAQRRALSFFGGAMHLPHNRDIDNRLVGGSLASAWLTACGRSVETAALFAPDRPAYYPPALTGMRGSMLLYTAAERSLPRSRKQVSALETAANSQKSRKPTE